MEKKQNRGSITPVKQTQPMLKKHVGLIHCENKLTLLQRKICNILLFNALDTIQKQDTHEISIRQLSSLVGYKSNDVSLIKKSLIKLISIVMEWNLLDDNKFVQETNMPEKMVSWHASALLAGASIERGLVRYSYSPQIKSILSSLEIYGRINLFVQAKFNSSYSLVLYENCVRFKSIAQTSWFNLDLFRLLMGVEKNKYASFKELKRNVITPAITEINQKSDIVIEPEYKMIGRRISGVKFYIYENDNYKPAFKRTNRSLEVIEAAPNRPAIVDSLVAEFNLSSSQANKVVVDFDNEYIVEKMHLVRAAKNVGKKNAYLISALKNDFKSMRQPALENPESSYLRDLKETSKITSLRNRYVKYKFSIYQQTLGKQQKDTQQVVLQDFEHHLKGLNSYVFNSYKKNSFQSPMVITEFIGFIEESFTVLTLDCLSFEDYLAAEEDTVTI
jgi:plasmid replication initiation protein